MVDAYKVLKELKDSGRVTQKERCALDEALRRLGEDAFDDGVRDTIRDIVYEEAPEEYMHDEYLIEKCCDQIDVYGYIKRRCKGMIDDYV